MPEVAFLNLWCVFGLLSLFILCRCPSHLIYVFQDVLFETINAEGVIADTIFQAVINIEKGIWNVSAPLI